VHARIARSSAREVECSSGAGHRPRRSSSRPPAARPPRSRTCGRAQDECPISVPSGSVRTPVTASSVRSGDDHPARAREEASPAARDVVEARAHAFRTRRNRLGLGPPRSGLALSHGTEAALDVVQHRPRVVESGAQMKRHSALVPLSHDQRLAGADGIRYLTAHLKRPGLRIRSLG
jgi:hypothetical protein